MTGSHAEHRWCDLPEHRILPAADPGLVREDPRNLAGGQPLSEHDVPCGPEEGGTETGRLKQRPQRNRINHSPHHHIFTT